jgi:hypothetical protein
MRRYHPIIPNITEARAYHDFGAKTNAANNKIKDFVNKSKSVKDAINKIVTYAKGTSGPAKKFADAIDGGKYTDWQPSDDIKQEIESYFKAREREKKMGPRANDPDQNIQVQIRGAADLRKGSTLTLDDGSKVKINQNVAKMVAKTLDALKPKTRKTVVDMLSKDKKSFTQAVQAIQRANR